MARKRIKKGILVYSTNEKRATLAERYLVEVRCNGNNNPSHAYSILGKRTEKEE